jgi:putative phosphoesterase
MRIAVLSDIHANKPALDAVIDDITADGGVDQYIFCGDIAGYYCWPNEVIQTAQDHDFLPVRGNHDEALAQESGFGFGGVAGTALQWNQDALTNAALQYLKALPYSRRETFAATDVYITHGSPRAPVEEYVYPEQVVDGFFQEQGMTTVPDVLLLGHTHVPFTKRVNGTLVMNPGSVGQPRDGNPDASYAVLSPEDVSAEIRRVSYDIDQVADRVREEGLPEQLAHRLRSGR